MPCSSDRMVLRYSASICRQRRPYGLCPLKPRGTATRPDQRIVSTILDQEACLRKDYSRGYFGTGTKWVKQDDQYMPDKPDQALNSVHTTWFETLHVRNVGNGQNHIEVCLRIFSDTYKNLFMSADCFLADGEHHGHAVKIPLAYTDHGTYLQAGCNVDVTNLGVCESRVSELTDHLMDNLEADQMAILHHKNWLN